MFLGMIFAYFIEQKCPDKGSKIIESAVLIIVGQLLVRIGIAFYCCIGEALTAQFFIVFGIELKNAIRTIHDNSTFCRLALLFLIWAYSVVEWHEDGRPMADYFNSGIKPATWAIPNALLGSITLISFVGFWDKHRRNMPMYGFFSFLGKNSLYIYGFHYIFIRVFPKLFKSHFSTNVSATLSFLAVLACVCLFTMAFNKIKGFTRKLSIADFSYTKR